MGARVQAGSKPGTMLGWGPVEDALGMGSQAEPAGDTVAVPQVELAALDHGELTL